MQSTFSISNRRIDPARSQRTSTKPDGSPDDNDRIEIGPSDLEFAEWAACNLNVPNLETARLKKELEKIEKESTAIAGRLGNPGFVAKAPEDVLAETRERKAELDMQRTKTAEALKRLG